MEAHIYAGNYDEYESKEVLMDDISREMLDNLRNSLSEVIFQKDYTYTRITECLALMYDSITEIEILMKALGHLKRIDNYTFKHSINTAFYAMLIAMWMDLSEREIMNATQAGLVHDIGKIYIPDRILNKKGYLTAQEYEMIQKHTTYGYFLLNQFDEFSTDVKRAVLFHHERADGSGYPLGAEDSYVGIVPKIVSVADVYDAMTTDRVYKKACTPTEAIEFLEKDGEKILDNRVIDVFIKNIPIYDFKNNN